MRPGPGRSRARSRGPAPRRRRGRGAATARTCVVLLRRGAEPGVLRHLFFLAGAGAARIAQQAQARAGGTAALHSMAPKKKKEEFAHPQLKKQKLLQQLIIHGEPLCL